MSGQNRAFWKHFHKNSGFFKVWLEKSMLLCLLNYSYLFHWKSLVPPMYLDLAEEIGCLGLLDGVSAELVTICLYTTKLYAAWARLLNYCKSSSLEAPSAWSPHHLSTTSTRGTSSVCVCANAIPLTAGPWCPAATERGLAAGATAVLGTRMQC